MTEDKIVNRLKEKIALSNLEEEISMNRIGRKKIVLSLILVFVVIGGLFTVDAATGGNVADYIRDTFQIIVNGQPEDVDVTRGTSEYGEYKEIRFPDEDGEVVLRIYDSIESDYNIRVDTTNIEVEDGVVNFTIIEVE
ncbi:MAG: hypothetical protein FWC79_08890 [Oscillospiraceae bacterium]|nr:hypothetical protein [Oscillospiraceae bacterium]